MRGKSPIAPIMGSYTSQVSDALHRGLTKLATNQTAISFHFWYGACFSGVSVGFEACSVVMSEDSVASSDVGACF